MHPAATRVQREDLTRLSFYTSLIMNVTKRNYNVRLSALGMPPRLIRRSLVAEITRPSIIRARFVEHRESPSNPSVKIDMWRYPRVRDPIRASQNSRNFTERESRLAIPHRIASAECAFI